MLDDVSWSFEVAVPNNTEQIFSGAQDFSTCRFLFMIIGMTKARSHVPLFLLGHFPPNMCEISNFCL